MSNTNAFSYEQTIILRRAVDMALVQLDNANSEYRRQVVAAIVLRLANENEFDDAEELAKLAIEKLDQPSRRTA